MKSETARRIANAPLYLLLGSLGVAFVWLCIYQYFVLGNEKIVFVFAMLLGIIIYFTWTRYWDKKAKKLEMIEDETKTKQERSSNNRN